MIRFLARRLVLLAATLLVSSFVIFSSLSLAPGNPLTTLAGGRSLSPESQAALEHRFNLDKPFLERYWDWGTNALHGDLGISVALNQDVSKVIAARAPTTAELVLYASLLIVLFGVGLGLLGALRPGIVDSGVVIATAVGVAVPSFVAAVVLISIFAVGLGWFPSFGTGSGFLDQVKHLTLPAVSLAGYALAIVARVTRASVRSELQREHVQTAVSRGIPYRLVIRRHALRNAAIPITTVLGITIASLIAAAAVVERAFNLNGLGSYLISGALSKDFAVVQGIALVLVTTFVLVTLIADILHGWLDPRVKSLSRAT
jgi:peptide/nickel transport system permease protein